MSIRRLPPLLVNQIAAGEVIERPASVVKELIENALDAGATRIAIDVADGGRELIRIADDGRGMPTDDLPLALTAHATSKISQPDDLHAIATLGFRGEALASIASISRLRLTSRTPDAEAGGVIEAAGETQSAVEPIGCAPGTVVEVRNLFFNTPARRKFLRGASTEFGHIADAVQRIALAHPEAGFKLTHNERTNLDLPPKQPATRRCLEVLGRELEEGLLEFDSRERGITLWGLAGLPALAKATTKHQYIYVNGRPIRDRHVGHAVKEAYRGLIEPNRQPMLVLFITLDPHQVDVNVHPAKAEVRFADGNAVHGQVLATLRQRLLGADLTPRADLGGSGRGGMDGGTSGFDWSSGGMQATGGQTRPTELTLDEAGANQPAPQTSVSAFVDFFKQMDPKQKGFVYQQVREALDEEVGAEAGGDWSAPASDNGQHHQDAESDDELTDRVRPASQSVLQVHNSYIVTQDDNGLVIIDQHALHERMMFQGLIDRVQRGGTLESQRLLTPVVVRADDSRLALLEQVQPLLATIGVEIEPMGPKTLGVQAFPSLLFDRGVEPGAFIDELLDRAAESDFNPSTEEALHEVLDMMSCKAAIKAGDALAEEELSELLRRKDQVERSSNCPHGRPTTVRLTLRDLEKHFKRG